MQKAEKIYSSSKFTCSRDSREFVCESSDLCALRDGPFYGRIYDDAADIGLGILSELSGNIAVFYLRDVEKDSDGDIKFWKLFATEETVRDIPNLMNYTVIVFND